MTITEVQVTPIRPRDGLVAFAGVVFDDELYLGSLGIHVRANGTYRITYTAKKVGNGQINICHPIRRELGRNIECAVIERCRDVLERGDDNDRYRETSAENGSAAHY